jgi:hypothetical protein
VGLSTKGLVSGDRGPPYQRSTALWPRRRSCSTRLACSGRSESTRTRR